MKAKFCPQCAASLELHQLEKGRPAQPVCPRCGHVEWQNPKPTVSALITRRLPGGAVEVLLTRRAAAPQEGEWDCPGGFIDLHEHPEAALRRETQEELGIEIDVGDFVGIFMDTYGDDGTSTLNIYYEAAIISGQVSPASDVSEVGWFSLARLPRLAFDNGRQALSALADRVRRHTA